MLHISTDAIRFAIFYSINIFANGFGSILAYGIMQLHGRNGYMGWRWYDASLSVQFLLQSLTHTRIFIINGAMTIFLAILGRILIIDFPDKVNQSRIPFLKPNEVQAIQDKLQRDRQDAEFDKLTLKKLVDASKRWELWAL